jgi:membrane protease YdiL (CAAX protease family)
MIKRPRDRLNTISAPPPEVPSPDAVPWTVREIWSSLGFLVVLQLFSLVLSFFVNRFYPQMDSGLLSGLMELALLIPVAWSAFGRHRATWKTLGLQRFAGITLILGVGIYLAYFMFNFNYSIILAFFKIKPDIDWVAVIETLHNPWWFILTTCLLGPFAEEVLFRGFIFAGLRQRFGWIKAMLVSAILFSLLHLQGYEIVPFFLVGCILAYLYQYSKSLWPSILFHILHNSISVALAFLAILWK